MNPYQNPDHNSQQMSCALPCGHPLPLQHVPPSGPQQASVPACHQQCAHLQQHVQLRQTVVDSTRAWHTAVRRKLLQSVLTLLIVQSCIAHCCQQEALTVCAESISSFGSLCCAGHLADALRCSADSFDVAISYLPAAARDTVACGM